MVDSTVEKKNETHHMKLPPTSVRECAVCLHNRTLDQYEEQYSDNCQHVRRSICNECVYKHTRFTLGNIHKTNVTCPESHCTEKFTYKGIQQIVEISQDKTLFEQYDLAVTVQLLKQIPEFVMCAHPGCNSGQLDDPCQSPHHKMTCIACKRETCSFHGIVWHTGLTCDQYDRQKRNDIRFKKWIHKNTKQCPKCHQNIEKNGGCHQMICKPPCEHKFCWECLADYTRIVHVGLHEHKNTCSHYQPRRSTQPIRRYNYDIFRTRPRYDIPKIKTCPIM